MWNSWPWHCLRDCQFSIRIWHNLAFSSPWFLAGTRPLTWIRKGLSHDQQASFLAGLWWIWRDRNLHLFQNENLNPQVMLSNIFNFAGLIQMSFCSVVHKTCLERGITWKPREIEGLCLHVDGSCNGSLGCVCLGGLICKRTANGLLACLDIWALRISFTLN